jgi:2-dehydropantoate 2-reductase
MKVTILGGGSIGLLFASYLSIEGHQVTIITRSANQMEELNNNGLNLVRGKYQKKFNVRAYTLTDYENKNVCEEDLLIVAVKQTHLKEIEPSLYIMMDRYKHLLFIQNGMGHLSLLQRLNHPSMMVGVVEHGALRNNSHTVSHTGIGKTKLAAYGTELHNEFTSQLETSSFLVEMQKEWYEMLAVKLVVNSVINPLTALFNVKNGQLVKNPYFIVVMEQLFLEAVDILELKNTNELWELVVKICNDTKNNTSSMLNDIHNCQHTEIDAISGFLIQEAKKKGIVLPNTEFVYNAIKGIEETWQ